MPLIKICLSHFSLLFGSDVTSPSTPNHRATLSRRLCVSQRKRDASFGFDTNAMVRAHARVWRKMYERGAKRQAITQERSASTRRRGEGDDRVQPDRSRASLRRRETAGRLAGGVRPPAAGIELRAGAARIVLAAASATPFPPPGAALVDTAYARLCRDDRRRAISREGPEHLPVNPEVFARSSSATRKAIRWSSLHLDEVANVTHHPRSLGSVAHRLRLQHRVLRRLGLIVRSCALSTRASSRRGSTTRSTGEST